MSVLSLERRLRKVETARSPERGLIHVLWFTESAESALAEAVERRAVATGDLVARFAWPFADELPPARWVRDERGVFDHVEFGCIGLSALMVLDHLGVETDEDEAPRADYVRRVEDARLVAMAFGERIGAPRVATLSEFGRAKMVDVLHEIGARARIRGCYGALADLERLSA